MSKARGKADVLICTADWSSRVSGVRRPRHTAWLKHAVRILVSVAREIFDESAYTRFLQRRQMLSSSAAYAAFQQEYEAVKARRPRCC